MSRKISILLSLVLSISTVFPCSGMSWTKISNRLCKRGAIFPTLEAAQSACLKLGSSACPGVYNERCDGRRSYVCTASPFVMSSSASCLYETTTFHPVTTTHLKSAVRTYLSGECDQARPSAPVAVSIQYCGNWGYSTQSGRLRKQLEDTFGDKVWVSEIRDQGVTGNFEVTVNGDLIWSKRTIENHGFPMTEAQVGTIFDAVRVVQRARVSPMPTVTHAARTVAGAHASKPEVTIQYCGGWGYGPKFRWLKTQLEEAFGGDISIKAVRDTGTTGNFEVTVNGDLIWSKRTWGVGFPEKKDDVEDMCTDIRDSQLRNK